MNAPTQSAHWPKLPAPLAGLFARFPLHTWPAIPAPGAGAPVAGPTLWLAPPRRAGDVLSGDVRCLAWQAHVALRELPRVRARWDVAPAGALGGRLPNLHVAAAAVPETGSGSTKAGSSQLLPPDEISAWLDAQVGALGEYDGYADERAREESKAWVALLEGPVRAALLLAHPEPTTLASLLAPPDAPPSSELDHALPTPAVPLFGFSSVLYSTRTRADPAQVAAEYADAVAALSERLGADAWLLGSPAPTFLDALAFAHVHAALASTDAVRAEVTRRVNLVAWERKVASAVRAAFRRQEEHGVA